MPLRAQSSSLRTASLEVAIRTRFRDVEALGFASDDELCRFFVLKVRIRM